MACRAEREERIEHDGRGSAVCRRNAVDAHLVASRGGDARDRRGSRPDTATPDESHGATDEHIVRTASRVDTEQLRRDRALGASAAV
jgi:hypothetical protein